MDRSGYRTCLRPRAIDTAALLIDLRSWSKEMEVQRQEENKK
jgi:hypothetical protein